MLFRRMMRKTRFVVDRWLAGLVAFPVRHGRDPAIAIGRALVDQAANELHQGVVLGFAIWPARLRCEMHPVMELRAGHPDCLGDGLHREPSLGCDKSRKLGFLTPTLPTRPSGSQLP